MNVKQLFALSVLAIGIQGVAQANYPADAEWSQVAAFELSEGVASWGVSKRLVSPHDPFPFGGGYIDD